MPKSRQAPTGERASSKGAVASEALECRASPLHLPQLQPQVGQHSPDLRESGVGGFHSPQQLRPLAPPVGRHPAFPRAVSSLRAAGPERAPTAPAESLIGAGLGRARSGVGRADVRGRVALARGRRT